MESSMGMVEGGRDDSTGQDAADHPGGASRAKRTAAAPKQPASRVFPFTAIVGQEEMRLALTIAAVDPSVGGVLVFGDRGTGKSTTVRALAALLPPMKAVENCPYSCAPNACAGCCDQCRDRKSVV